MASCSLSRLPALCDRFKDIPKAMRSQIVDTSIKVMQDNIKEIFDCNVIHGFGWGALGRGCRSCFVELARQLKVAESAGVEIDEDYKSLLTDLRAREELGGDGDGDGDVEEEEQEQNMCQLRRKRQREKEEKEEIEREFKRCCRSLFSDYLQVSVEEEEEEEEEEDRR